MRVTKKRLTKKEEAKITKMVDSLVTVDDFTLSIDFAEDAYALFKEELSKRKIFKSFWELFKDIRGLYAKFRIGDLMKNVDFYNKIRNFFRYFINSSLFRELDKLDPIDALEKFLKMFQPPQPQPPQPPQPQSGQGKGKDKGQGKQKQPQGPPKKQSGKGQQPQKGQSPSGKSKDKKGLSADEGNLPIDMSKFRQKIPKIEKAIDSGLFDKEDFQKYIGQRAGIGHKEVEIGNIVNLIEKIASHLSDKELDIFYVARKKELTEKYRREEIRKSVPYPDNEMNINNIQHPQELLKILPTQYAFDDEVFTQKLLKKELLIRDYQSRRLKRQALYLLIDVSGSMDGSKNVFASGVGLAFVRQAIDEGSTYFLRFFDDSPHSLHKITNKRDAERMADTLVKQPYSGGGTDIEEAIRIAVKDIKNSPEKFEKAEIMVITDGEDDVSLTKDELKGVKVHVTVIDGQNAGLKEISDTYVELDSRDIKV